MPSAGTNLIQNLIVARIAGAVRHPPGVGAHSAGCGLPKETLSQRKISMNKENLTVHFKVKDFNTWRTSYNGRETNRVSAGITNGRVFRSADDPNDVVILQDVADVAKARTWYGSDE